MKEGFLLQRNCRLQKQSFPSTQNSYFSKHRAQPLTAQRLDERSEGRAAFSSETSLTSRLFPHLRKGFGESHLKK